MEEVERLCNRLILLKNGKSRLYGDISKIKSEYGGSTIALRFNGNVPSNEKLYSIAQSSTNTTQLIPVNDTTPTQILQSLVKSKDLEIQRFEVEQMSLDDIFIQIYQEDEEASNA